MLVAFSSCTPKQETKVVNEQTTLTQPLTQSPTWATEELGKLLDTYKDAPYLSVFFDSIKVEYPGLVSDFQFLDSIKGLKIDFIGTRHSGLGVYGPESDSEKTKLCQISIGDEVAKGNYEFIGVEDSYESIRINLETFLDEMAHSNEEMLKVGSGQIVHFSREDARICYSKQTNDNFVFDRLFSHNEKPYIIGTEPKWVWMTEQYILAQGLDRKYLGMNQLAMLLGKCRSEIALSRTARYLKKVGADKKAVITYGSLHLSDFKVLSEKFGTVSRFITPKSCE